MNLINKAKMLPLYSLCEARQVVSRAKRRMAYQNYMVKEDKLNGTGTCGLFERGL